ncbi:NUDIX hydrolase [Aquipuribacter sp. SD81]|uniref:NUDIX hydrolase n=1 Tax=Aquipuribacter sp. SD81 TaxID=3127703 RepID=UPI003017B62B
MPTTPKQRVRVLALAAARREDGRLLVQRGTDPAGGAFHRLVGGGVEFGETAAEALARELHEELGTRARVGEVLVWHENLFTFAGKPGHEVVAVCEAVLDDPAVTGPDDLGRIPGTDSTVHWVPAEDVLDGPLPFHPQGVVPALRDWYARVGAPRA